MTSYRMMVVRCTWQVAKTQLPRDRHYQRIALSPWGNYSFRVLAQNAHGISEPSESTRDICTTAPDVPHINPRHVCTRNLRPHSLVVTWQVATAAACHCSNSTTNLFHLIIICIIIRIIVTSSSCCIGKKTLLVRERSASTTIIITFVSVC